MKTVQLPIKVPQNLGSCLQSGGDLARLLILWRPQARLEHSQTKRLTIVETFEKITQSTCLKRSLNRQNSLVNHGYRFATCQNLLVVDTQQMSMLHTRITHEAAYAFYRCISSYFSPQVRIKCLPGFEHDTLSLAVEGYTEIWEIRVLLGQPVPLSSSL